MPRLKGTLLREKLDPIREADAQAWSRISPDSTRLALYEDILKSRSTMPQGKCSACKGRAYTAQSRQSTDATHPANGAYKDVAPCSDICTTHLIRTIGALVGRGYGASSQGHQDFAGSRNRPFVRLRCYATCSSQSYCAMVVDEKRADIESLSSCNFEKASGRTSAKNLARKRLHLRYSVLKSKQG